MRLQEIIMERVSSKVFHLTNVAKALEVLKNKQFKLTSIADLSHSDARHQKGKHYYLSLSRNPLNDYSETNAHNSVMFNLNGDWFNQRYKGTPVDYWDRMWLTANRTSEQEDRVLSDFSNIPFKTPSDVIDEIHILNSASRDKELTTRINSISRKISILAKQYDIPVYFYTDKNNFLTQNKNKAVSLLQLSAKQIKSIGGGKRTWEFLKPWIELYYINDRNALSEKAKKISYDLQRIHGKEDLGFTNEINNARTPGGLGYEHANHLLKIMRKEKLSTTKDYVNFLQAKWKNVK
jgi:hypothetical protein